MDSSNYREHAGVLVASGVVLAYVAIGFVSMFKTGISVPAGWNESMLTLAGMALGFLIGKQTTGTPSGSGSGTLNVPVDPAQVTATVTTTTEAKK